MIGTLDRVETARLSLERLRPEHAADLAKLLLDPRVRRTLWPHQPAPTEVDVLDSLDARIQHWGRFGFGLWMLRDRATDQVVGRGGLQHTYVAGLHEIEAGWAITPERWGQGLATELAVACVDAAFGPLRLREIIAFTLPDNVASRRVMEKAGFAYDRDVMHVGLRHVLYRRGPD